MKECYRAEEKIRAVKASMIKLQFENIVTKIKQGVDKDCQIDYFKSSWVNIRNGIKSR
jgi:hypothetical protein